MIRILCWNVGIYQRLMCNMTPRESCLIMRASYYVNPIENREYSIETLNYRVSIWLKLST